MSRSFVLKAVIDTNIFISGIIKPGGRPSRLLIAWRAGKFELLLSDGQYAEIRKVFDRPKILATYPISPVELAEFFTALNVSTRVVPSSSVPLPIRDENDEPILAAAIGGGADYLVTGDLDLLVLRDDPRLGTLRIVTANHFLAVLEQEREAPGE